MSAFDEDVKEEAPSLPNYVLAQSLPFHSATVRTIAHLNVPSLSPHSIYLTGSIDQSCKLYRRP